MSLSAQEKNIITGCAIALVIAAGLAFLAGRLTAEAMQGTETASTAAAAPAATTTVVTTVTKTVTTTVTSAADAADVPVAVIDQKVTPSTPNFGQEITFSARVSGEPAGVFVIFGPAGGDIGGKHELPMAQGETTGTITTWTLKTNAIHGFPENDNKCIFRVVAITTGGQQVSLPDDGVEFKVNE